MQNNSLNESLFSVTDFNKKYFKETITKELDSLLEKNDVENYK